MIFHLKLDAKIFFSFEDSLSILRFSVHSKLLFSSKEFSFDLKTLFSFEHSVYFFIYFKSLTETRCFSMGETLCFYFTTDHWFLNSQKVKLVQIRSFDTVKYKLSPSVFVSNRRCSER